MKILKSNQQILSNKWCHTLNGILFFLIMISSFGGCSEMGQNNSTYHYLHLSHTLIRDNEFNRVDPRVEQIDFQQFDLLMLGGDLTINTSKDRETINYVDGLFDLNNPDVLWSVGNYDKESLTYVTEATNRPTDYSYYKNGITYLVLNTQNEIDWKCYFDDEQLKLVDNVADTIHKSSHLIVLTHNLLWLLGHPEMRKYTDMENLYTWACNKGVWESNWREEVLPRLQRVYRKKVNVICLAGDVGNNVDSFEYHTADGITYLASGINQNNKEAKVLLFRHEPPELVWDFVELEKYIDQGQELDFKGHKRPEGI